MNNFNIITSNRLEILMERLVETLESPLSDPFEKEIIVVQSQGMEKFISLELAHKIGIASNIEFLYPNSMLERCIEKTKIPNDNIWKYSVDKFAWTIMDILPEFESDGLFDEVFGYVGRGENLKKDKLYQFSLKISELFQQYQIFRPDWILKWENPEDDLHWQSVLWKRLSGVVDKENTAALIGKIIESYNHDNSILDDLPTRISIFGIFSIPRIYLESLSFFSGKSEINFFLLNPCREYWGDIASEKKIAWMEKKLKTNEDLYLESGNRLLASFGESGKNFFQEINEYYPNIFLEDFIDVEEDSILSGIQSSVLNLMDYQDYEKNIISKDDRSIRIHSCHGPMREMEVLRDNILMLIENDEDLNFGDILVMIPDIEKYSPYINSVFSREIDNKKIPFSIADRSFASENKASGAFIKLLEIFKTRFEASIVLNIFEEKIIHEKFNFTEPDLNKLKKWINRLKISWGIDSSFKLDLDLPEDPTGTWKKGVDSLVLGYAFDDENISTFNDLVPGLDIETSDIDHLTGLTEFIDGLKSFYFKISTKEYNALKWLEILNDLIDFFFSSSSDYELEILKLKDILRKVSEEFIESEIKMELPFSVVFSRVQKLISATPGASGFLDGRITFCAMIPMRSIPFKMIAISGMNDGDFPRNFISPDFDLIVKNRRPGDRNVRDDDRYLFLETLISARKYFYITYIGKDYKTDTIIPPSVVVSELLDYINLNFELSDEDKSGVIDLIFRQHKAPSFSEEYFLYDDSLKADNEKKNFSFSRRLMELSSSLEKDKEPEPSFFTEEILSETIEDDLISLDKIISFFKNPQKFFLEHNNISVNHGHDPIKDREIFKADGLENYFTSNDILELSMDGIKEDEIRSFLSSKNMVPFGKTGELYIKELEDKVAEFKLKIQEYLVDEKKEAFTIKSGEIEISGNLNFYNGSIFLYRFGSIKPVNLLELYIKHLAGLFSKKIDNSNASYFAGLENSKISIQSLGIVEKYEEKFNELVEIFLRGLKDPVFFHPVLSHIYAKEVLKLCKNNVDEINDQIRSLALFKAKKEYESTRTFNDYSLIQRVFRGREFFDYNFMEVSEKIFFPVIFNSESKAD